VAALGGWNEEGARGRLLGSPDASPLGVLSSGTRTAGPRFTASTIPGRRFCRSSGDAEVEPTDAAGAFAGEEQQEHAAREGRVALASGSRSMLGSTSDRRNAALHRISPCVRYSLPKALSSSVAPATSCRSPQIGSTRRRPKSLRRRGVARAIPLHPNRVPPEVRLPINPVVGSRGSHCCIPCDIVTPVVAEPCASTAAGR
jgi:hypothetical protein